MSDESAGKHLSLWGVLERSDCEQIHHKIRPLRRSTPVSAVEKSIGKECFRFTSDYDRAVFELKAAFYEWNGGFLKIDENTLTENDIVAKPKPGEYYVRLSAVFEHARQEEIPNEVRKYWRGKHPALRNASFAVNTVENFSIVNKTCPALVLIQWGQLLSDGDDVARIVEHLERQFTVENIPSLWKQFVQNPIPQMFAETVELGLRENPWVQTFYIGAHGDDHGLCPERDCLTNLDYLSIFDLFRAARIEGPVTLVLGACSAMTMNRVPTLESMAPECITEIRGFSGLPNPADVAALMAQTILDDMRLFRALSAENAAAIAKGVGSTMVDADRLAEVFKKITTGWEQELQQFNADEAALVEGIGGCSLVIATRSGNTWTRRSIDLA